MLGPLYIALVTAIDRLTRNTVADATDYILRELYRGRLDYWREQSMDIRPPASTNSTRKARGLPPHLTLKRQTTIERRGQRIDPLRDDETLASAGYTTAPADLHDEVFMVAETPIQRAVLCEIMDGASEREIAAKLGVTRHRVRRILEILRLMAQRAA